MFTIYRIDSDIMKGTCFRSAIEVTTLNRREIDACHCGMCRRWGGGLALSISCGSDVTIDGIDN